MTACALIFARKSVDVAARCFSLHQHTQVVLAGSMVWTARSPPGLSQPARGYVALSLPVAVPNRSGMASQQSVLAVLQGNDVVHLLDVTTGQSFIQV
jgi:hypothetical protein